MLATNANQQSIIYFILARIALWQQRCFLFIIYCLAPHPQYRPLSTLLSPSLYVNPEPEESTHFPWQSFMMFRFKFAREVFRTHLWVLMDPPFFILSFPFSISYWFQIGQQPLNLWFTVPSSTRAASYNKSYKPICFSLIKEPIIYLLYIYKSKI